MTYESVYRDTLEAIRADERAAIEALRWAPQDLQQRRCLRAGVRSAINTYSRRPKRRRGRMRRRRR